MSRQGRRLTHLSVYRRRPIWGRRGWGAGAAEIRGAVESVASSPSAIERQIEDSLLSDLTHGIVDAFSSYLDMPAGFFATQSLLRQIEVQRQIAEGAAGPVLQVCLVCTAEVCVMTNLVAGLPFREHRR